MAVLDLTLNNFRIPGFDNFDPEFGTKEENGISVSSVNVVKNAMMPFTKQRPVLVVENSTTTEVESDCLLKIENSGLIVTLNNATFVGCKVNLQAGFENGLAIVQYTYKEEQKQTVVSPNTVTELVSTLNGWVVLQQNASGNIINTSDLRVYNRRYLYPSVFNTQDRNKETDYVVQNDEEHSKATVYIRAGSVLPEFYVQGLGYLNYATEEDVTLSVQDVDDTCGGTFDPGKDYFIYLVYSPTLFPTAKDNLGFKISLNDPEGISIYGESDIHYTGLKPIKAYPIVSGAEISEANAMCIGGFHTVCSDKTSLAGVMTHPFANYLAGHIHPYSVWDAYHRPQSTTVGMSYVPTINKWCAIYLATERGLAKTGTWTAYGGTYPKQNKMLISAFNKPFVTGSTAQKYHCLRGEQLAGFQKMYFADVNEFVALSLGSPQGVNIAGSTNPVTSGGHLATGNKDIISYCGIEDTCGVLWQWGRESGGPYTGNSWANAYDANDTDVAGQYYNNSNRVLLGGIWGNGVSCGSRTAVWNNVVLALNSHYGFRLLSSAL